jgi:hypothetical protein
MFRWLKTIVRCWGEFKDGYLESQRQYESSKPFRGDSFYLGTRHSQFFQEPPLDLLQEDMRRIGVGIHACLHKCDLRCSTLPDLLINR